MVKQMSDDLLDMCKNQIITPAITGNTQNGDTYEDRYRLPITKPLLWKACDKFIESLENIIRDNKDTFTTLSPCVNEQKEMKEKLTVKNGCYVATAVYGSYDCPEVWTLRRYRDYSLAETWYGRAFIYTYYAISPALVKWFGHREWFKKMWKGKLDRMVKNLHEQGFEATPYEDRNW